MNGATEEFPFVELDPGAQKLGFYPVLPVTLSLRGKSVTARGVLDTGAAVNVLPFTVGTQLGANWDQQTVPLTLTGVLAGQEARAILLETQFGRFSTTRLAFAWVKTDSVRLLFGQVNFFQEYDVCFFRSRLKFEIRLKAAK